MCRGSSVLPVRPTADRRFVPPRSVVTRIVSIAARRSRVRTLRAKKISRLQHRASDRNRKKVEYPEIKAEEVPPLMTIVSEK